MAPSTVFFLGARALDSLLTATTANRYGMELEANPLTRYMMESLGVEEGLLLNGAAETSIALPIVYKKERLMDIKTTTLLYIVGSVHLLGAATHVPALLQDYLT